MNRTLITAAIFISLSAPAFASYAPIKYHATRDKIAERCSGLGDRGESWGLDGSAGTYGCRNTDNGAAVSCNEDNLCTDYSGDYRWKRIQIILKGGKPERQPSRSL